MSDILPNNKFTIRLEMKSDWHIGTGAGIPGSVDALLARDGDGFPCVPAKTVVGIWRDALETLTFGLDDGDEANKVWQKWVDVIFGSQPNQLKQDEVQELATEDKLTPRSSILSIQPTRLNENLRNAIKGNKQHEQALTFIKPNTKINSESGTAETESLRFTEMGRIGTVLEAEFKLDFDILENIKPEQKELIEALLVGSASLVERIGGNRRRGSGKCLMQVVGAISKEKAITILRDAKCEDMKLVTPGLTDGVPLSVPPEVGDGSVSDKDIVTVTETSTEQIENNEAADTNESTAPIEWKKIKYSLTLQTPVAIVTNTLGNVSETLDFIPGTYLLPHITKQLKGISTHIASGDFQVLPATIDVDGKRGLPVPKVFLQEKMNESKVYNRLQETEESLKTKPQVKPLREGFISTGNGNFTHSKTPKILLMHNTVKDEIQRPDETVGGVFSRQAIKAGTVLRGEIRFKKSIEDVVKSLENYKSYVRLGTSKKDDYGLAELTLETLENGASSAASFNNGLIVYLESDVLLRNGNLRQTNLVDELKAFCEKEFSVSLKEKDSHIQVRRIESWHEGWGFPRPTLTAMAAGSVVVFDVIGTINPVTLQNLELSGIGERRGEGYGQVSFNPLLLLNPINAWTPSTKTRPATDGSNESLTKLKAEIHNADKLKEFISNIELSAWRDELARAVLKLADNEDQRKKIFGFEIQGSESVPSLSQIGGLRSAISRLRPDGANKNVVTDWLNHLKTTENRRKKWDSKTESGSGKLQRIRELINDENKVWLIVCDTKLSNLKVWNTPNELIHTNDNLRKKLWAEAVKSLFDACARAHKRETEDK